MDTKILGFLVIFTLLTIIPVANAQLSIGEKATQKSVEVFISLDGDVHVKHVIVKSNLPKQVDLIYGTVSNISVTNNEGEEKQFSIIGDNTSVLILPSDTNSVIEYDLDHVLTQKDNVWTWSFLYLETTDFLFPEQVDLIYANERTVFLDEKRGITCHGCQILLKYSTNEPQIFKNVKWKDNEFIVEIKSHSNIEEFVFDQPTKSITFRDLDGTNFVNVIIPLELLWEPYTLFHDDGKIFFRDYNNGTHVWLNFEPEEPGEIMIVGTTVIPEFPVAPLVIGFLIILIIPLFKKINLHQNHMNKIHIRQF
ncbi:MAG: hypothetical protein K5790_08815 [Nitrosopumilus sp.]|uniref:hypothetical protein n=1 Tax=Nitrosopumilus sp. TaxID=2024843 RepID=UPI00247DB101|nr:hypothetical protein [Nitrosopumilus sp.]MCV0393371.1 hypothetical protein [Nitrosopumilus sp.]